MRNRTCSLLLGTLLLVFAALAPASEPKDPYAFTPEHRTVFFAVLEGLYEDGVSTKDVERIMMKDPALGTAMHFVYGCPLCGPAHDALSVYRARTSWPYKGPRKDTFGPGLDAAMRKALASDDFAARHATVQALIKRWVERRLILMRVTDSERAGYSKAFEGMSKKGNAMLAEMRRAGRAGELGKMKGCAVCDGATEGCRSE